MNDRHGLKYSALSHSLMSMELLAESLVLYVGSECLALDSAALCNHHRFSIKRRLRSRLAAVNCISYLSVALSLEMHKHNIFLLVQTDMS